MSQIKNKFIENASGSTVTGVDGAKFRLQNAQPLRARNAANSADVDILSVNASDVITMAGALSMGTNKITNLVNPTAGSQEAATANYVDAAIVTAAGANKTLSNLTSPTSINQNLLPSGDNTRDLGSSSLKWNFGYFGNGVSTISNAAGFSADNVAGTKSIAVTMNNSGLTLPSGNSVTGYVRGQVLSGDNPFNIGMFTETNSVNSASATGGIYIESGNKSAGTGNSGDIKLTTGTSAGGTRGSVYIKPELRIEGTTSGYIGIKSTAAPTSYTMILPSSQGGAGTILTNDGSGNLSWGAAGGAGTVTSVAMSVPAFLSVSGSPITSSGTLAVTLSGTALPIANGGTNSTTALNNNRVMQSNGGAIVEAAAITPARALISDANGIPTQSVTTSAELAFVSGVTSNIQTQLNAKGVGSVTSVAMSVPAFLSVSGSPITSSGTLAVTLSGTALPIANGGTNSTTALTNNRIMVSSGGAIVVASAITANRALVSNASGIPIASSVTDATLAFLDATSSVQTQLNGKASTTLNNLGTTSINANLLFNADATYNIGSTTNRVNILRASQITGGTGASIFIPGNGTINDGSVASIDVKLREMYDSGGFNTINYGARTLKNSSSSTMLSWSGTELDVNSHLIKNVADPVDPQDAATKAYVDNVAQGLKPKAAVRVATTTAGTLASSFENGDTIDGVVLATGDRILIKNQSSQEENGIYIVNASGAPTRSTDFDSVTPIDEINGAYTLVQFGTANAGTGWVESATVVTVGTDPIVFQQFTAASSVIGGDMITVSGATVSVDLASVSGLESTNPGNVAGQLRVKLEASNPTLQIDGSNQLGAKLDAAGAIVTGASGIKVQVNSATQKIASNSIEGLKDISENLTLNSTDITNQYKDLSFAVYGTSASVNSVVLSVVGGPVQQKTVDYTVSLTGGSGGVTRITFAGDLATAGAAALVSGDILMVSYSYLT